MPSSRMWSLALLCAGLGCSDVAVPSLQDSSGVAPQGALTADGGSEPSDGGTGSVSVSIHTAEYQAFYLVDGKVLGIGSNRLGQLGFGTSVAYNQVPAAPIAVDPSLRFQGVAGGGYQSIALDVLGRVWTFGDNRFGQRGDGTTNDLPNSPAPGNNGIPYLIPQDASGQPFNGVVSVRSGLLFNLALKQDGSVWVWGHNGTAVGNSTGIAGDGDTVGRNMTRPFKVPLPTGTRIVDIATNDFIAFALDEQGHAWAWGGGAVAQENLGTGRPTEYAQPRQVAITSRIVQLAPGGDAFAYALDDQGRLWGWGVRGTYLGLGSPTGGWNPVATPRLLSFPEFGAHRVVQVAASGHTTHVILDDGTLWGWGDSAMGEVGNGAMLDFATYPTPYRWDWGLFEKLVFRPVQIAPGVTFRSISTTSESFYCYAVATDGRVFSWGRNKTGILGNGVLPTGDLANRPDSWNVATAAPVPAHLLTSATPTPSR
ncbi:hypothetical protein JGU66_23680 [Myxococcaceae bacterium JPH2]|nr:hypothetical protein [Myxococcaceae bacterium JPH2]